MNKKIFVNLIFVLFINISLSIVIFSIYSNIFTQKYVNLRYEKNKPRFLNLSNDIYSIYERLFIKERALKRALKEVDQIINEMEIERKKNFFISELYNINSTNFDDIISDLKNDNKLKFSKSIIQNKKNGSTVISSIALSPNEFDLNFIKIDEIIESLRNKYFVGFYNLIKNRCINKNECFKLTNYLNDNFKKLEFYKIEIFENVSSSGKHKKFFYYYVLVSSIIISLNYKKFNFIDEFKNKPR